MSANINESKLIKQCLLGDEKAWEELYKNYYNLVRKIIFYPRWNFKTGSSEDLIQEVFVEVVKALKSFKYNCKLSTFIAKIAQNKCVSILRKELSQKRIKNEILISLEEKHSSDEDFIQATSKEPDPETAFLKEEEKNKVRLAITSLKKECRKIIFLRYFEDKSYEEIAKMLKLPLGTVCVRISRCLLTLRKFYSNFCD